VEVGSFHFLHDVRRISFAAADDGKDAELQNPFPHLALCVLDVHGISFLERTKCKFLYSDTNIGYILVLCKTKYHFKEGNFYKLLMIFGMECRMGKGFREMNDRKIIFRGFMGGGKTGMDG